MHHWQDLVLTVGSLVFAIALIPSLLGENKPALTTSVMTSTVLFLFAFVYLTLSLWFSATATAISGLAWLALAIQKHSQKPK